MFYEVDFAFINSHPMYDGVMPLAANTALVGGMHTR